MTMVIKETSNQFEATLTWRGQQPMLPGRAYTFRYNGQLLNVTITKLKFRLQGVTREAVNVLKIQEQGVVNLSLDNTIHIQFDDNKSPQFELLDSHHQHLVAVGVINHGLRRAINIPWQELDINKQARAQLKQQKPCVIWLTGFSGSGKSTIANLAEKRLHDLGRHSYILDGDNLRHGLNKDLGFTDADRVENIRRTAETAKLMADAGLIVLASLISPFCSERRMARDLLEPGEFFEIFIDTPLAVCEQRDPKGLYKKARNGQIKNFTGFDSPYEPPKNAELVIDTTQISAELAAEKIVAMIEGTLGKR